MRLIHKVPFNQQEVETYRQLVFNNITHGLRAVLEAMGDLELKVADENQVRLVDLCYLINVGRSTSGICGNGFGRSRHTRWGTFPDELHGAVTNSVE